MVGRKPKKKKGITTPNILPGEKGWEEQQKKKARDKETKNIAKRISVPRAPKQVGKIKTGANGIRIGRPTSTYKGETKYPVWRYKRKIGEIVAKDEGLESEEITLTFNRLGGMGNYKHLIQDADFQLEWMTREQELLMTQESCHLCNKKISKTAIPNLYHLNMFQKRTELLEKAALVPAEVVSGKLTLEEGWDKFNDIIEEGNRYYMSLQDTVLLCQKCAKGKGIRD
jgi:hypothetical protein